MRPRKKDRDLPPRMHRKHGAFWHVKGSKWTRLAGLDDQPGAFREYAALESDSGGDRLSDAVTRFLTSHVPTLSPATQKDYTAACMALTAWAGHLRVSEITPRDVARYLAECQPATLANKRIAVLSSICGREVSAGRCDFNPCLGVRKRRNPKREYLPSQAELDDLRGKLPPRLQAAMDLALLTALRLGDLLALKRSDWTEDGLRVRVRKTKNLVVYERTEELAEVIARCGKDYLVEGRDGGYTVSGFESTWQKAKIRAGYPHIRWHDLRARALTDAAQVGGRDYAQALAAHASGTTTERYLRDRGEVRVMPLSRQSRSN